MPDQTDLDSPEAGKAHHSFETAIFAPTPLQPTAHLAHDLTIGRAETTDEIAHINSAAAATTALDEDVSDHFSSPPSRSESRDSFTTPVESRAQSPELLHAEPDDSYNRGRQPTPTYIPKGYPPLSGRAR